MKCNHICSTRLIREAEKEKLTHQTKDLTNSSKKNTAVFRKLLVIFSDLVFASEHQFETGIGLFWSRICALLTKRWHMLRRQYSFIFVFFIIPIIAEILIVSIFPSPKDIQTSLMPNTRVKDAQVTLLPSIYNPHTIVFYSSVNNAATRTQFINYIQNTSATIDEISNDTVLNYVNTRCLASEEDFVNKYQIGFDFYSNDSSSLRFNSYFSTVNYHTMATSLSVGSTNLFRFYANSSTKKIITINQPIITQVSLTNLQRFFELIYCFDTIPLSLFNFLNGILAAIFISILIVPLIQERITQSKDLQLLTNLTKKTYWLSNIIFDLLACLLLSVLLTIIVKVS